MQGWFQRGRKISPNYGRPEKGGFSFWGILLKILLVNCLVALVPYSQFNASTDK